MLSPNWDGAKCRDMDSNTFFPVDPDYTPPAAKAACEACPIMQECRTWAFKLERYGFWGGLTEGERWKLNGAPRGVRDEAGACGSNSGYRRHYRQGEPVCDACRKARSQYQKLHRTRQKVVA